MEKEIGKEVIEALLNKASKTVSADDAMKFAQAACNVANTIRVLADIKKHLT